MWRTDLMDVDRRAIRRPPSRGTGVIEMNVSQEDVLDVNRLEAVPRQALDKCSMTGTGAGFDENRSDGRIDQVGGDPARESEVLKIDCVNDWFVHLRPRGGEG